MDWVLRRKRAYVVLWRKQNNLCAICRRPMRPLELTTSSNNRITLNTDPVIASIDHINPRRAGGTNKFKNLRLTHRCCNEGRDRRGGIKEKHNKQIVLFTNGLMIKQSKSVNGEERKELE